MNNDSRCKQGAEFAAEVSADCCFEHIWWQRGRLYVAKNVILTRVISGKFTVIVFSRSLGFHSETLVRLCG